MAAPTIVVITSSLQDTVTINETFINPYDNTQVTLAGTFAQNNLIPSSGTAGVDDLIFSGANNDIIRLEDENGNLLINSFEQIFSSVGNDFINFASLTNITDDLIIQAGAGDDIVWANAGNDLIIGDLGNDILNGGPGDDTFNGGDGNDQIFGGVGNDTVVYGLGDDFDTITESSGASDTIAFGSNILISSIAFSQVDDDLLITIVNNPLGTGPGALTVTDFFSGDADKVIENLFFNQDNSSFDLTSLLPQDISFIGTSTLESFTGGGGNDTVDYSASEGRVIVDLEAGTGTDGDATGDTLVSIESIVGADLSTPGDFIFGNSDVNNIQGLGGRDVLEGGGGADIIDGGENLDYARYTRSAEAVDVDLTRATQIGGDAEGDVLIDIENLTGSAFNDTLTGDAGDNILRGENGDDTLSGGLGDDRLVGGRGSDTYIYTSGQEIIEERENGIDNDTVIFDSAFSAQDVIISGNQLTFANDLVNEIVFNDITLIESFVFGGQTFDLSALQAFSAPTMQNGSPTDTDVFIASIIAESFNGDDSSDTVDYSQSTSRVKVDLEAGSGTDGFAAGDTYVSIENIRGADLTSSGDFIFGNSENNFIEGLGGRDVLEGGAGADIIDGGAADDYTRYTRSESAVDVDLTRATQLGGDAEGDILIDIENVTGSAFDDTLTGDAGRNILRGENGNDTLDGAAGNDLLFGGRGDDTLNGGLGADNLYGQDGADTFLFEAASAFDARDTLRDFDLAEGDVIDVSDLLAGYDPLQDAITDFIEITTSGDDSFLAVDTDGGADNFIEVARIVNVTGLEDEVALETAGTIVTV